MVDAGAPSVGQPDLAVVTAAHFRPHLESDFSLELPTGARVTARLVEVTEQPRARAPGAPRVPFALLFRAARDAPPCHATVVLSHPVAGRWELYTSTVMPDDAGARYEIVIG